MKPPRGDAAAAVDKGISESAPQNSPISPTRQTRGVTNEANAMNQERTISKPAAPRAQDLDDLHDGDDIALLKARIVELEADVNDLDDEVVDIEIELEAAPDPDLLADIRRDLEQGDVEYALIRIGRAIGW